MIVDGNSGVVYVKPSDDVLAEYKRLDLQFRAFQKGLEHLRDLPAETLDGYRVSLLANVGLLADLDFADLHGAEGIGLFRTELPFLSYRDFPSENEQLALYRTVIDRMGERPVTIKKAHPPEPETYGTLGAIDELSNALVGVEAITPPPPSKVLMTSSLFAAWIAE